MRSIEKRLASLTRRVANDLAALRAARAVDDDYDPDNLRPGLADPDAEYALPRPRSSWDVDCGGVRELDFGGGE